MFRHIVEGWSRKSYEDAIFAALRRASELLSATTDVHVFIRSLSFSEEQGYHAVLELSKEPMSLRHDFEMEEDSAHHARMEFEHQFRLLRQREHVHLEHVVAAHFEKIGKFAPPSPVPDFILAHMTDVSVENDEVEREFDHAVHSQAPARQPEMKPKKSFSKEPEPEPE